MLRNNQWKQRNLLMRSFEMVNGFCWYFFGGGRKSISNAEKISALLTIWTVWKVVLKNTYFRCVITAETTNKDLCTVGFSFKTMLKNEPVCFFTGWLHWCRIFYLLFMSFLWYILHMLSREEVHLSYCSEETSIDFNEL